MAERGALLEHYRGMRRALMEAIDGLSDELLVEQSLDGWSVKDHLAHLALWDEIRAADVERISAGYASAWHMQGEQDGLYSALGLDLRAPLSPEQVRWEITHSHRRLLDAISAATEVGLDESRYGEAGLVSTHEQEHTGWIRRWRGERGV